MGKKGSGFKYDYREPKVRREVRAMWSRNAKLEILYDWASLRRRELVLIKEFKRW